MTHPVLTNALGRFRAICYRWQIALRGIAILFGVSWLGAIALMLAMPYIGLATAPVPVIQEATASVQAEGCILVISARTEARQVWAELVLTSPETLRPLSAVNLRRTATGEWQTSVPIETSGGESVVWTVLATNDGMNAVYARGGSVSCDEQSNS